MVLRLYYADTPAGYTPTTFKAGWEKSTGTVVRKLSPTKAGAVTTVGVAETSTSNTYDVALARFVSDPFTVGGTLSTDTLRLVYMHSQSALSSFRSYLLVYVTQGDTDAVRGRWTAADRVSGTTWSTTEIVQRWSAHAPDSPIAVQAGDRLVFEIGARAINTTSSSRTANFHYGGTGTDLAETDDTDPTHVGWVDLTGPVIEGLWTPQFNPPGAAFNLDDWKLTLPTGPASDATEITQPTLETYADTNFKLDDSNRTVMTAPVQGSTTSGSGGTRCEFREMEGGAEADWAFATSGFRQLTVSGMFDPTNITDRKEMIVGQIHGETGTPPVYLAVEHHVATPRLRLFKSGSSSVTVPGVDGLTATTEITYRMRIVDGRLKLWAAIGGVANLPAAPQYDWATSELIDVTGCYFKAGAYNKSTVAAGGTGEAKATITHLELIQPGDPIPADYPEPGRFLLAY